MNCVQPLLTRDILNRTNKEVILNSGELMKENV